MESTDFAFAVDLANSMNWNMTANDFAYNSQIESDGCLMLVNKKDPVGLATCINLGKIGWFGNLVVQETYRKQSAGAQLIKYAVTYLKGKGANTIGLYGYPHLTSFYGKIGFKPDCDFAVLKAPIVYEASKPQGNIRPIEKNQIPAIIHFDCQYFGGFRGKVLDPILNDPKNFSFAALNGDHIIGYVTAKVLNDVVEIGPLICTPNNPVVAAKLLQTIISQLEGKEAYLYLKASEAALLDLAHRAGFMETFRLVRMFLGALTPQNGVYAAESLERG